MIAADSLAEFYDRVRAGMATKFAVATEESLDYPHILMTYSGEKGQIISMADAETEVGRATLENPSIGEIDEAAVRALQEVQSRPFRSWTHAQIDLRVEAIRAEQARLDVVSADLDSQIRAVRGESLEAIAKSMPLMTIQLEAIKRHSAYSKQIQIMNYEMYIRDN